MNKEQYSIYLQLDHWQKVKKAMYSMKSRCHVCFIGEENLNIHHLTYENIGNEGYFDLVVLCKDCHKKIHEDKYDLSKTVDRKSISELIRERAFFLMVYLDYNTRNAFEWAEKEVCKVHGNIKITKCGDHILEWLKQVQEDG